MDNLLKIIQGGGVCDFKVNGISSLLAQGCFDTFLVHGDTFNVEKHFVYS